MSREAAEKDYMSGMKYKDIAEKYAVSIDTVKSWKKRYGWNRKGRTQIQGKGAHKKEGAVPTEKEIESVMSNPALNDKQRLFCLYYTKSFNATKSYQKAYGVDYETAASIGYRLLENDSVRDEIMKLKRAKYSRALLEPGDLFQKYMDIAFADITDYMWFDGETITLNKSTEVDGSLLSEVSGGNNGVKIKLNDRMKALQWLTDHMDMATEEQRARIDKIQLEVSQMKGDAQGNSLAEAVKKMEERRRNG